MAQPEPKTLGEKMQSVSRHTLFTLLIVLTSIPLFFSGLKVPNIPDEASVDLYAALMKVPQGSTILFCSDWTNSTRGENGGAFEGIFRILMRRGVKAAIYCFSDAQAPQVARNTLIKLAKEAKEAGQPAYEPWKDYVVLGFFPNGEGTAVSMATNLRNAFSGRTDVPPGGNPTDVFQSPVLEKVQKLEDVPLVMILTSTKSSQIQLQRFGKKAPIAMSVTGVMGPETRVYYQSGQIIGLGNGLKGVYDLETCMEHGVNDPNDPETVKSEKYKDTPIPAFKGMKNLDRASKYYPTLHVALILLITAVVVGNVGMVLAKKKGA